MRKNQGRVLKCFNDDFNGFPKKTDNVKFFLVQVFYEKGLGFRSVELVQDPMEIEGRIFLFLLIYH